MARNPNGIISLLRYALPGLLVGAILGTLFAVFYSFLLPTRFDAQIVLFHSPGSGLSDSGRDFIAATLAQENYLEDAVTRHGWDREIGELLANNLSVVARGDAAGPIAEIHLIGSDETTVSTTLSAIAIDMIDYHRDKQTTELKMQLKDLDAAIKIATQKRETLQTAAENGEGIPPSAEGTLDSVTDIIRQQRELEMVPQFRLRLGSDVEDSKREQRLRGLTRARERLLIRIDENADFKSDTRDLWRNLIVANAELNALQNTKQRIQNEFEFLKPLQIAQPTEVSQLSSKNPPLLILAVLGGAIGVVTGTMLWSTRRTSSGFLTAQNVAKSLHVPVLGVIAAHVVEHGERVRGVLAESNPEHLALASVHSLNIAIHLLARGSGRSGPAVFAEVGTTQHARHIIANLAILCARAGEKVLVVDDGPDDNVLSSIFLGEGESARRNGSGNGSDYSEDNGEEFHREPGLIRYMHVDNSSATLPIPSDRVAGDFDRIFILTEHLPKVRRILERSENALAFLVCAYDSRLSTIRHAHPKSFNGLVLTGCPIDDTAYRETDID